MKGHYNVQLLNARGLSDRDFNIAQKDGTIDELLDGLEIIEEYDHDNQLSHYMAGELFYRLFGAPTVGADIQDGNIFHYMGFGTDPAEYDYSFTEYNLYMLDMFVSPNGDSADSDIKRTSAAVRTHQVIVEEDATGLRAAHDIQRYLWTPSQANSTDIREIKFASTNSASDVWYYADECRTIARTRIKDANGNPQTIAKTSNEVILVQWTITMKSI
jgi:hypothetical protein